MDLFDRMLGALDGVPGVLKTSASTVRVTTPVTGASQTFSVQTFRQLGERDEETSKRELSRDTVFIEYTSETEHIRIPIPHDVVRLIIRQHDQLTTRARKRAAKHNADSRKQAGIQPAFLKHTKTAS